MSAIAAIITGIVGLFGLTLWQAMVDQNRARREARHHKVRRPALRLIQGGKA